jgi:hypothetical protein
MRQHVSAGHMVRDSFPDGHVLVFLVRDVVTLERHGLKSIVMDQHEWG